MRRCLRPPPKTQGEFEQIICSTWGNIHSDDACCIFEEKEFHSHNTHKKKEAIIDGYNIFGSRGFHFSVGIIDEDYTSLMTNIIACIHTNIPSSIKNKPDIHCHRFMRSLVFNVIIDA